MKDSILMAIESLCDDIATNTDAEENRKRAASIAALAISGLLLPDDVEDGTEETEGEPTAPEAKSNMPKSGDRFTYNGMSFIILGEEQGAYLPCRSIRSARKCLLTRATRTTGENQRSENI